ncbi:subtilisin-like protease SBT1.5 [Salvia divinorum]|uniref:Subtilisin-like protease SBT1.5 n=1 Tax=Salvia divinorum TaxID=28513 RepID=A0ABD1H9A6_SALDI
MHRFWCLLLLLSHLLFSAVSGEIDDESETAQTFVVRVENELKPSAFSDVEHWYKSTLRNLDSNPSSDAEGIGESREFMHIYRTVFHGFSAKLTPKLAQQLQKRPEIIGVFPDRERQLQTTRSPQFLGLTYSNPGGLLTESDSGANVVIGVLDTGIWPERRSFHDEGLGPIPSNWKGECVAGVNFTKNHCNRKIIGARYYVDGYEARWGRINSSEELKSARDTEGHGTHTASTAAGRAVGNASFFGYAAGVAVGMAPKARIAVYKICWRYGCMDSDILAAFDQATRDGVNVISISVGGGVVPYYLDLMAIGTFGAMEKGILVSAAGGNDGPSEFTVSNVSPWMVTVGASTIDRSFPADLVLGDGRVITGASLYSGPPLPKKTFFPLIYAGNASIDEDDSSATCFDESLDENAVRGKIVVCDRGGSSRVAKDVVVRKAGGVGIVVANDDPIGEGLIADPHVIPGLAVSESAGKSICDYINSSPNPRATMAFRGTKLRVKPAPVVASFSARGPNPNSISILKPDVIAPGVNILAAWPAGLSPTELDDDPRLTEFNVASGTSMSCPHVSGIAALLKGAHADWSPAMIRSALMTTAYSQYSDGKPLFDGQTNNISSEWVVGAGHVDPQRATDPGLVYDLTAVDYLNFLCALNYTDDKIRRIYRKRFSCGKKQLKSWDLNYPAIVVQFEVAAAGGYLEVVVTRTVTHVGDRPARFAAAVTSPRWATVTVTPAVMKFRAKGEKISYRVRIKAKKIALRPRTAWSEAGKLVWSDGRRQVSSPVVVFWRREFK